MTPWDPPEPLDGIRWTREDPEDGPEKASERPVGAEGDGNGVSCLRGQSNSDNSTQALLRRSRKTYHPEFCPCPECRSTHGEDEGDLDRELETRRPWWTVRGSLPEWLSLPGDLECDGDWSTWVCPEGGEIRHIRKRCRKVGCFRCQKAWAVRTAARAKESLVRALEAKATPGAAWWHVHVDPPDGAVDPTPEGLAAFKKRAHAILAEHGVIAACTVVHYARKGSPGRWRPHLHALGAVRGPYKPGPTAEGWVIRFERELGRTKPLLVDAYGLLVYELGHALRLDGKHALVWTGAWSYAKRKEWLPRPTQEPPPPPTCPEHGCELLPEGRYDAVSREFIHTAPAKDRPPPREVWDE